MANRPRSTRFRGGYNRYGTTEPPRSEEEYSQYRRTGPPRSEEEYSQYRRTGPPRSEEEYNQYGRTGPPRSEEEHSANRRTGSTRFRGRHTQHRTRAAPGHKEEYQQSNVRRTEIEKLPLEAGLVAVYSTVEEYCSQALEFMVHYDDGVRKALMSQIESCKENVKMVKDREKSILFCGGMSVGKSRTISSIIENDIMPFGKGHTTSKIIRVSGVDDKIRCEIDNVTDYEEKFDSMESLEKYLNKTATHSANHGGEQSEDVKVSVISIQLPRNEVPFFQHNNVTLIDSPGFTDNKTFQEAVKKYFGKVMLVVLIIDIDHGILEQDRQMIEHVKKVFALPSIYVVINKCDTVEEKEKASLDELQEEAEVFLRDLCSFKEGEEKQRIFQMSALKAIQQDRHYTEVLKKFTEELSTNLSAMSKNEKQNLSEIDLDNAKSVIMRYVFKLQMCEHEMGQLCNCCKSSITKKSVSDIIEVNTKMEERFLKSHCTRLMQMQQELRQVVLSIDKIQEKKKQNICLASENIGLLAPVSQQMIPKDRLQNVFKDISKRIDNIAAKNVTKSDDMSKEERSHDALTPSWHQTLILKVEKEVSQEINKILKEARQHVEKVLVKELSHDKEKRFFQEKLSTYQDKFHVEHYRIQDKEEELKNQASRAQNFSAGTVIANAATTILGVQAVGGTAGAAGGVATVLTYAETVTAGAVTAGAAGVGLAAAGLLTGIASMGVLGTYISKYIHLYKSNKELFEHLKKVYEEGNEEYVKILLTEIDKLVTSLAKDMRDLAIESIQETANFAKRKIEIALNFDVD